MNPVAVIIAAQVLNGVILPVAVIFLVVITTQTRFMREFVNSKVSLTIGVFICIVTLFLGIKSFGASMDVLFGT